MASGEGSGTGRIPSGSPYRTPFWSPPRQHPAHCAPLRHPHASRAKLDIPEMRAMCASPSPGTANPAQRAGQVIEVVVNVVVHAHHRVVGSNGTCPVAGPVTALARTTPTRRTRGSRVVSDKLERYGVLRAQPCDECGAARRCRCSQANTVAPNEPHAVHSGLGPPPRRRGLHPRLD